MKELIRITKSDNQDLVDARELYEFLDVESNFTTWFGRMVEYGFAEGVDFVPFLEESTGGRPRQSYSITLDMAKHIAMLQRSEKGMQARAYFIEVEKKGKFDITNADMVLQLAQQYKMEQDKRKRLERIVEQSKSSVKFTKAVRGAKQSCLVCELAKILRQNGINIGQNRLFDWLRKQKYLGSNGERYNQPMQKSMDMGLFEIKKSVIIKPDGEKMVVSTTKVTTKGQVFFVNKFLNKWQK